jgi:hypothetical protein
MPRAQVRRRLSEELFEVLGHGLLWFNDEGSIIGAADVVESASLTELRHAIDRYRATVDDVEVELLVYDVDEQLLLEDDGVVSPRDVSLELVHYHTFIDLTLTVDPKVRFNKNEVAAVLQKETSDEVELLTAAPKTGVWKLDENGRLSFARWGNDWHSLVDETEAFYLRVAAPGDYRYKGADLGVLVTRGRLQTDDLELNERCRRWIAAIKAQFVGTPVESGAPPPTAVASRAPHPEPAG